MIPCEKCNKSCSQVFFCISCRFEVTRGWNGLKSVILCLVGNFYSPPDFRNATEISQIRMPMISLSWVISISRCWRGCWYFHAADINWCCYIHERLNSWIHVLLTNTFYSSLLSSKLFITAKLKNNEKFVPTH